MELNSPEFCPLPAVRRARGEEKTYFLIKYSLSSFRRAKISEKADNFMILLWKESCTSMTHVEYN